MDKWKTIWSIREEQQNSHSVLEQLIMADGYDRGVGYIEEPDWRVFVFELANKIGIAESDTIFEVGCGSGADIYCLYEKGYTVAGLDYSETLIKIARSVMPEMVFSVSEADALGTDVQYDIVISNSCFHYFPSAIYAETVLQKMFDKSKKAIAILDVPDLATKKESEISRQGALGKAEYQKKYEGLEHYYYSRNWFSQILNNRNYNSLEIFNQNIDNYGNSIFRYNVVIKK